MLDDYWTLMPQYQQVSLDDLQIERILFGFFPTYRNSPLRCPFDRVLQVGDASGIQSPLSFGGFGALTRHISRCTRAVEEALDVRFLFGYRITH
jgi:lycopene cyclase CruP